MLKSFLEWPKPISGYLRQIRSILTSLVVILVFGLFTYLAIRESFKVVWVLDPIEVPKVVLEYGYTPNIVSERMQAEAEIIYQKAITLRERREFAVHRDQADIKIPGEQFSIGDIVRYIRFSLGGGNTTIRGEITWNGQNYALMLRSIKEERPGEPYVQVTSNDLNDLIRRGSEELVKLVDPYILAKYFYELDLKEVRFTRSLEMVIYCLQDRSSEDDQWAYNLWGNILHQQKKYTEAIEKYQTAINIAKKQGDSSFALPYINWGVTLFAMNQPEEAIKKYEQASKINGNIPIIYYDWGYALEKLGQQDKAIENYKRAVKIDPTFAKAYYQWGRLLEQKSPEEAINIYKEAIKVDIKYALPYINWGGILVDLNRAEDALSKYQKATEVNPNCTSGFYNWGLLLYGFGRYKEAIDVLGKAIELAPDFVGSYYYQGTALAELHRFDEAISVYKKAIEISPNEYIYTYWGGTLGILREYKKAVEKFRLAVQVNPDFYPAYQEWGVTLAKIGKHMEAIEKYKKVLDLEPTYYPAYAGWGNELEYLGKYSDALEKYEMALDLYPNYEFAYRKWVNLLRRLGRNNEIKEKTLERANPVNKITFTEPLKKPVFPVQRYLPCS